PGRCSRKNASLFGGPNAIAPARLVSAAAAIRFPAMSLRNAVLKLAASSKVSGGQSLVFVRPGCDAFAITATPQNGMLDLRDGIHLSLLERRREQPADAEECLASSFVPKRAQE